jgi:ABC-type branched-subunit amino acid transport system substrate-binding protein
LTVLALLTASCGTTVPLAEQRQQQSGSGGLVGGSTSGLSDGLRTGDGAGGTSGGSSSATGTLSGVGSSPSTGPSAGGGSGATSGSGGVRTAARGPIKIGALTLTGAAKLQASIGVSGATGDQTAMTRSMVDYINAHGGFGGRKVELVLYDLNEAAFVANAENAAQAACTYFTQDKKVSAVASIVALLPATFYRCMADAHVPVVSPDEGVSRDFFQQLPNTLYTPAAPNYTRLLEDSVEALWSAGWLTSKSVVGVVGVDTTDVHAIVDKGLVPALKRHGLQLTAGLYTATDSSQAGEYNGGVLSFNSRHVDRVFFAPGGQPYSFATAAQSQRYYPRYELSSLEYTTALTENLPAEQLRGSMGIGWLPYLDLPSTAWPSAPTPGIADCRKALAKAAQDFTTGTTLAIGAWICDDWNFLRDVFNAGAMPDEASIRRVAETLGGSFRSAATFRTHYAPGRTHDGVAVYRLQAFQDACTCYKYVSPQRPLP